MDHLSKKRRIASDFEKQVLVQLVQKEKIVECRENTSKVWKQKKLAWERITKGFNEQNGMIPTDMKHLKKMWDNLKSKTKKDAAKEKKERNRTGGGKMDEAAVAKKDEIFEVVSASIGNLEPLHNDVDCDASYHEEMIAGERQSTIHCICI